MCTLVPPVFLLLAAMPPAQEPSSPPPLPSAETLQQEFDLALRAWADANNKARGPGLDAALKECVARAEAALRAK